MDRPWLPWRSAPSSPGTSGFPGPPISYVSPAVAHRPGSPPGSGLRRPPRSAGSGWKPSCGVIMTGSRSTRERIISKEAPPAPMITAARRKVVLKLPLLQDAGHLHPARQVLRQSGSGLPQPPQIDDPAHTTPFRPRQKTVSPPAGRAARSPLAPLPWNAPDNRRYPRRQRLR